jgi:hypothetical protein
LGIKKQPLLPHFYFVLSAWARAVVIGQGTKSKRIGAKSAKDFAEKNLGDLFRAPIAPTKTQRFSPRALHLRVSLKPYEKTTKETGGLI